MLKAPYTQKRDKLTPHICELYRSGIYIGRQGAEWTQGQAEARYKQYLANMPPGQAERDAHTKVIKEMLR